MFLLLHACINACVCVQVLFKAQPNSHFETNHGASTHLFKNEQ